MARLQDGQPLEAIIDVPPLHERYVAVRGQGVWRNGEPLQPLVAPSSLQLRQPLHPFAAGAAEGAPALPG